MGYNTGKPMGNPEQDGVLSNVQTYPCNQYNCSTPYFELRNGDMDEYIFNTLQFLASQPLEILNTGGSLKNSHLLPDGGFKIHAINTTHLNYTVLVNDHRLFQYHRNNAITKAGARSNDHTIYQITSIEG